MQTAAVATVLHKHVDRSKRASGAVCANLYSNKHLLLAWSRSPWSHPQRHTTHVQTLCIYRVWTSLWTDSWRNARNIMRLYSLTCHVERNKIMHADLVEKETWWLQAPRETVNPVIDSSQPSCNITLPLSSNNNKILICFIDSCRQINFLAYYIVVHAKYKLGLQFLRFWRSFFIQGLPDWKIVSSW